jgi:hypothetical protein
LDVVHPDEPAPAAKGLYLHGTLRRITKAATDHLGIDFGETVVADGAKGAAMVDLNTTGLRRAGYQAHNPIVAARAVELHGVGRARELGGGTAITAYTHVFLVDAIVLAPPDFGAVGDFKLVAVALHVVHPDGVCAAPVRLHCDGVVSGEAQRPAHYRCVSVAEAVIAHCTPLPVILHLKTARATGAPHKARNSVVARWAQHVIPHAAAHNAGAPRVSIAIGRDDITVIRYGEERRAPATRPNHPHY